MKSIMSALLIWVHPLNLSLLRKKLVKELRLSSTWLLQIHQSTTTSSTIQLMCKEGLRRTIESYPHLRAELVPGKKGPSKSSASLWMFFLMVISIS
ncbi:PREDICTED: uncharacterized protein LOC109238036 isoform X1 [Nicotiana attenuata]|uniref:uncharacterized protein LOC109238036 isoform X1 n=1 Tax=Nicotiana attenuata TaxID=49451 RepID=UPI0009055329|nr:PREDICTED: uncharacterized protein LOC109238036 isoform X1 [Nicotiana attenuata]